MNMNWITNPLAIYTAVLTLGVVTLYLILSTAAELQRRCSAQAAQIATLRDTLGSVGGRLEVMEEEALLEKVAVTSIPIAVPRGINLQKRSEAIRMLRKGGDPRTISAHLGLSLPEVALLAKIYPQLAGPVADDLTYSTAELQERSSN